MKSEVYFARVEARDLRQRVLALERLLERLSPVFKYRRDEIVPVKLTIGDSPCIYHLSPELVRVVVSEIKKKGARPFLFDTSVIYKGQRQNAVDHLNLAQSKGFGHDGTGAPFIVADGVLGQDGREFSVDSPQISRIKVPSFVGMLDSLTVLSHVTGHIVSGYAGALKNVAMGMSCRPTKQVQHSSIKPSVIKKNCTACGCCVEICPVRAISFKEEKACIEQSVCIGCGECICACKFDAISINWQEEPDVFCRRMVEVAGFILSRFKNKLFFNFAFDITKECDCISTKKEKMIAQDIGILASSDIVSIDKASADLACVNKISEPLSKTQDVYFGMFEYAAKKGLGRLEYKLVEV